MFIFFGVNSHVPSSVDQTADQNFTAINKYCSMSTTEQNTENH